MNKRKFNNVRPMSAQTFVKKNGNNNNNSKTQTGRPFSAAVQKNNQIQDKDFDNVMKAAHRIKGSTSYLCCEVMKDISLNLQLSGHDGLAISNEDEIISTWKKINELFEKFNKSFTDLKNEISKFSIDNTANEIITGAVDGGTATSTES